MIRPILSTSILVALAASTSAAPTVIYDNFRTDPETGDLRWGRGGEEVGLFGLGFPDHIFHHEEKPEIFDIPPTDTDPSFPFPFPDEFVHSEYKANAVRIGAKESAVVEAATLALSAAPDSGNWHVVIYSDNRGVPGQEIARSESIASRPRIRHPEDISPFEAHEIPLDEEPVIKPPREGGRRRNPVETFEFEESVFLSGGEAYWFALESDETGTPGQTAVWFNRAGRRKAPLGEEIIFIGDEFPPDDIDIIIDAPRRDRTRTNETAHFDSRDIPPPEVMEELQTKLRRSTRRLGNLSESLEIARGLAGDELADFLDSLGVESIGQLNEDTLATRNHVQRLRQLVRSPGWVNPRDGDPRDGDLRDEEFELPALVPGSMRLEGTLTTRSGDGGEDGLELVSSSTRSGTTATVKNIETPVDPSTISFRITELEGSTGGFSTGLVASDVIEIEGLDGVTFVLEVSYDETRLADENDALVYWFDEHDGTWKNAVLGNDYGAGVDPGLTLGAVFGAYDPTLHFLGAYGVDTDANTAWAVINHNSSFIVVPEPSRALVAAFGLAAIALRRRRRS